MKNAGGKNASGNNSFALIGARLFDGERFHENHAPVVQDGWIVDLVPVEHLAADVRKVNLGSGLLCPGFIDAQVNGGGGVMLNEAPTVQTMHTIVRAHRNYGTTSLLPTLISDVRQASELALVAATEAVRQGQGVVGLHLEGPHLSPVRKGAHLAHFMHPMHDEDVTRFCHAAAQIGTLLITVAAEQITQAQVRQLTANHVIVSIGHSDTDYARAMHLFDAGARGVTHLFNAMSQLEGRRPGLVGAALDHPDVWAGIIADGHHVDSASLRIALRAKNASGGEGRIFFVTDAMALLGSDSSCFTLHDRRIERMQAGGICSRLTLADGTLAGSDLDMISAIHFGIEQLDLSLGQALAMATSLPARFLRLADRGFIRAGARADLVHLDDNLQLKAIWTDGQPC